MPSRIEHDTAAPGWPKNIVVSTRKLAAARPNSKLPGRKGSHTSQYPRVGSTSRGSGEIKINPDLKQAIWGNRLVLARDIQDGQNPIPSLPTSPTGAAEGGKWYADRDHDGTQSPHRGRRHEPTSPSKKVDGSAVRKATGGRQSSRSQRRRNSRLSIGGDDGNGEDDDGSGADGSDSGCDSGAGLDARPPKRLLACPFYKHNSGRYMSCIRLRLTRVRDVKQHLNRRHRRPMHCPICGDIFADSQCRDAHIRARTCVQPPDGFDIEGVTETQSVALARRVNRSLSEASQWFSIWEILFPGSPRPSSPYLSNHLEEALDMVYDYWRRHQHALVTELVEPMLSSDGDGSRVAVLSSRVVETLLFRFRTSSRAITDPASPKPNMTEPTSHHLTGSRPGPTAITACPPGISPPPPPPPSSPQQQQQSLQCDAVISASSGNTYTVTDNADSHAAVGFPQSQCTPGDIATADTMSGRTLSRYSIDMVQVSPHSQLDPTITMCANGFLTLPCVHQPGPTGPLTTTHLGLLEPTLAYVGAWPNAGMEIDINYDDQVLAGQDSGISLGSWAGEPIYVLDYSDPNFYQNQALPSSRD